MGGGRRVQIMARSSTLKDILSIAKKLFFPNGSSLRKLKLTEHSCYIADSALNKIEDQIPFTHAEYKNNFSLKEN